MRSLKSCLALPVLLLSSTLFAHTELIESSPVDGDVLTEAPATLDLTFSAEVQLVKLELVNDAGAMQKTDFAASADRAQAFSIALPPLEPSAYAVSWTILGADGHRVEGNMSFLVDAKAHEPADTAGAHDGH
ncbi:MAG: copper resistance CopC family protein [Gammaproteobacteria bacterium]